MLALEAGKERSSSWKNNGFNDVRSHGKKTVSRNRGNNIYFSFVAGQDPGSADY